jgi:hypothetical protein
LIPNISERLDSRFRIVSVAISLHTVTVKRKGARTTLTNASKVLRTIVRIRAMAKKVVETAEQSSGRAIMGKDYCKASPNG